MQAAGENMRAPVWCGEERAGLTQHGLTQAKAG